MKNINIKLYQACIAKDIKLYELAKLIGISKSRFSKILHKKLKIRAAEKRKLSQILRKPQKDLF